MASGCLWCALSDIETQNDQTEIVMVHGLFLRTAVGED